MCISGPPVIGTNAVITRCSNCVRLTRERDEYAGKALDRERTAHDSAAAYARMRDERDKALAKLSRLREAVSNWQKETGHIQSREYEIAGNQTWKPCGPCALCRALEEAVEEKS